MPHNWIEIDLAALRHNFRQVTQRTSPETQVVCVVKSEAYGHGMLPVAHELVRCGAGFLAVSKLHEARELREAGIELPILVLLGIGPDEAELAVRLRVRPALFRLDHAVQLSHAACLLGMPAYAHIKVDTGMARLGIPVRELGGFIDAVLALPGVQIEGILSHLASADENDKSYCGFQVGLFQEAIKIASSKMASLAYAHIANSAGILDVPMAHFQLVRPGIMLYGSQPSDCLHYPASLNPVMAFKSRIIQLKNIEKGQSVGYGCSYISPESAIIATIPVGYDDGYPRTLSNRAHVLIGGRRSPVVGRVSMNMIIVDVTSVPDPRVEDEVVLLGRQGEETITAEELAALSGTISYEIYCSLGKNRFKYYLNGSDPRNCCEHVPKISR